MNLKELKKKVDHRPAGWREGQAYFNYAYSMWPELVDKTRGMHGVDPFHVDAYVAKFIEYLKENGIS